MQSARRIARILTHSRSGASARLVLIALALEADESGCVRAKASRLAGLAGLCGKTVQRMIDHLVVAGEVLERQQGKGRGNPSIYQIAEPWRKMAALDKDWPAEWVDETGHTCPVLRAIKQDSSCPV